MNYIYSQDTVLKHIEPYQHKEMIALTCPQCFKVFHRTKKKIQDRIRDKSKFLVCTNKCQCLYQSSIDGRPSTNTLCGECGKSIIVNYARLKNSKSGYVFCSQSCAASYNNKHKHHGTRSSKLEKYLFEQVTLQYPNLKVEQNNKKAIGSELDLYFPDIQFAIELNGILHFEAIYGLEKLSQIQQNDIKKFKLARQYGIELCVIDTSHCNHLTEKMKSKYLIIVLDILSSVVSRRKI